MAAKIRISRTGLKNLRNFLILLIFLVITGMGLIILEQKYDSPQKLADEINNLGAVGPFFVILLIVLEVVVAPIPGFVIAIASGFAFGAFWGTVYTYIGNIIGTAIAFLLSKKFGRPLAEHIVEKRKLDIYDCFFREKGKIALWFAFIFPVFPTDIISFVTGLSNMRLRSFMLIVAVGYLPNLIILNYFGSTIYHYGFGTETFILGSIFISLFLFGGIFYWHLRKNMPKKC